MGPCAGLVGGAVWVGYSRGVKDPDGIQFPDSYLFLKKYVLSVHCVYENKVFNYINYFAANWIL